MITTYEDIVAEIKNPTKENKALIKKACVFAERAHEGQKRKTGEPYSSHAFATGRNLAIFGMDTETIVAGITHDTIEDTNATKEELEKEFGKEVAFLVEGTTKLGKIKYRGLERHVESMRKLFVATAIDVRVLIIKLADRLHNMETLHGHTVPEKQKRIALETLEVYAPLAGRLGMGKLKGELEDFAFPFVYPKEYKEVKKLLGKQSRVDEKYLEKIRRKVQKELAVAGIQHNIKMDYRIKHLYSLYKKLLRKNMDITKIYDIVALRIIVPSVAECYRVLGIIHGAWRPLPETIRDYIATPKPSGYQSLHTTIFTGDGGMVEIQIRTDEMHREAKYGIAAHAAYKEGLFSKNSVASEKLKWVRQLGMWQDDTLKTDEFLNDLRADFFKDRVFVFTPKGDVIDLPEESTVIDLAYAIHSDIGHNAFGARVNGKFVGLDTRLKSDDIVEVETRKNAHPSAKWLEFAKTALAKKNIRASVQKIEKQRVHNARE